MLVSPPADLDLQFCRVRSLTEALAEPLSPEDQTAQSMPDASPTKWHRAHTTWFFETFVLEPSEAHFVPFDPSFRMLFNSYYEAVGPKYPRNQRGLVTRPGASEVGRYRNDVDRRMRALMTGNDVMGAPPDPALIILGLHHEQQHQELLVMDAKHLLSHNPSAPAYSPQRPATTQPNQESSTRWIEFDGGLHYFGADTGPLASVDNFTFDNFTFDNERPSHRRFLEPFALADRLVTVGEWRAFIEDGGYERPDLWLSDGWHTVNSNGWERPIYWHANDATAHTLGGIRRLHDAEPVSHVSHFEADAFARWAGARLPTEFEWEHAAASALGASPADCRQHALDRLEPEPVSREPHGTTANQSTRPPTGQLRQLFGECWQWTQSAYLPYPEFEVPEGAVGEYNGKFMSGQMVLRGSSSLTPPGHARSTYRNFFPPSARWPMTGLRLAKGLPA